MGGNPAAIQEGLWGYNPVLAAIAVGVRLLLLSALNALLIRQLTNCVITQGMFFYPTPKTFIMAIICASFSSIIYGFFVVAVAPWG